MKEEKYGIPQLLEGHCINCYVIDALLVFYISNLISAFFHYQSVISSDEL